MEDDNDNNGEERERKEDREEGEEEGPSRLGYANNGNGNQQDWMAIGGGELANPIPGNGVHAAVVEAVQALSG